MSRFSNMARSGCGLALVALMLNACQNGYSPDHYSSASMQQASKVDRATVQSVRSVDVDGTAGAGALVGGAAGGIGGSSFGSGGGSAAATLGGVLVGAAIGALVEKSATDTQAFEYIVQKQNGDLMSVTQKDAQPLAVGQKVMLIYGVKARLIPDTSNNPPAAPAS
ncbi:hypothetical protein GCM10011611_34840 [Aliidongia dinghuensis]|uniref:Glycine zipper 2TM domain-containing protein n=1 Tax=Aliidongia dinghuensis TaxID=1867774 RepID=A0A8J2YVZ5_9PROT|nr:hypothetical protein [Aliidongia dinghuensis]GGF25798.1 hypothetical protein GCM10011611_34840 [Aliidongia dinghuensis]